MTISSWLIPLAVTVICFLDDAAREKYNPPKTPDERALRFVASLVVSFFAWFLWAVLT